MDAARDIRRRLDRLTTDPASIEGSWHPEVDALRHPDESRAFAALRTLAIAAIAVGPTLIATISARTS